MIIGMSGTFAVRAMRTAPFLISLISSDRLMVASGKTPTSSPAFSAATASRKAADPASRSTGMCFMPRMSGPATGCLKMPSFAMNRTRRWPTRSAGTPPRAKSR